MEVKVLQNEQMLVTIIAERDALILQMYKYTQELESKIQELEKTKLEVKEA